MSEQPELIISYNTAPAIYDREEPRQGESTFFTVFLQIVISILLVAIVLSPKSSKP